jgi:hypothetical protein
MLAYVSKEFGAHLGSASSLKKINFLSENKERRWGRDRLVGVYSL